MSSSNTEQPTQGTTETSSWCGRVKWFNNKAGYGFITASDGDRAGEDVFVHHSALVTTEEHKRLSDAGLRSKMPKDWDGKDPFARYKIVGIEVDCDDF